MQIFRGLSATASRAIFFTNIGLNVLVWQCSSSDLSADLMRYMLMMLKVGHRLKLI